MPTSDAPPGGSARVDRAGPRRAERRRRAALGLSLVLVLAGCELTEPGLSERDDELARRAGTDAFAVVETGEERAVFAAAGSRIVIEPPEGYCLDEDSVAVSQRSAFVLVADCMQAQEAALANGADRLPRAFPGILTVTVSGEEAFGSGRAALASFERLLGTEAGAGLLGRGNDGGPGRVVAMNRVDGALYVLVEEVASEGGGSLLAPRFWRAFTEINGRLVLVTVSGFSDRPMAEEEMLAFLAAQMAGLRRANGLEPSANEERIAAAVLEGLRPPAEPEATPVPKGRGGSAGTSARGAAPGAAPAPQLRPGRGAV
jgi:hypothetical protein